MNDRNSRAAGPHPKAGPAPQNAGEDPTTAPTPMTPPGGKGTHPPTQSAWAGPAPSPAGTTGRHDPPAPKTI